PPPSKGSGGVRARAPPISTTRSGRPTWRIESEVQQPCTQSTVRPAGSRTSSTFRARNSTRGIGPRDDARICARVVAGELLERLDRVPQPVLRGERPRRALRGLLQDRLVERASDRAAEHPRGRPY